MSIFDRNILITTGITAVICGAVFYYLNLRIRELEMALAKQSQVLSSFIVNVQQEFRASANANASTSANQTVRHNYNNELASEEAIRAVADMVGGTDDNKIVISDNECDSDDESESDDESVSVSDNESVSDDDNVSDDDSVKDVLHQPKIINLSNSFSENTTDNIKIIDITDIGVTEVQPELLSDDEDTDEEDSDSDYEHINIIPDVDYEGSAKVVKVKEVDVSEIDVSAPVDVQVTEVDVTEVNVTEVDVTEVDVTEVDVSAPVDVKIDDLRVDDLRKLSVEQGLVKKEEAKKLKKNELLALFKK